jgi:phage shock protein E
MKRILFILIALITLLTSGLVSSVISTEMTKPFIIDVRTEEEWNNGHIEGSILIPYEQIGEKIDTVAKDTSQKIYVYCKTGRRSTIAKETLDKLGYKDVVNLGPLDDAAKTLKLKIVK